MNHRIVESIITHFELELCTGMRIGGSEGGIAIGAIDDPVIRDPLTQQPYIPGSSLKGKLRSLVERLTGTFDPSGGPCKPQKANNRVIPLEGKAALIGKLFGIPADAMSDSYESTRLIVRDAFLTKDSQEYLDNNSQYLDARFTETKMENAISRITGGVLGSGGLRTFERVPRGALFACECVLTVWDCDDRDELLKTLAQALILLETDYLGSCGSRGYGQVRVIMREVKCFDLSQDTPTQSTIDYGESKPFPFHSIVHNEDTEPIWVLPGKCVDG